MSLDTVVSALEGTGFELRVTFDAPPPTTPGAAEAVPLDVGAGARVARGRRDTARGVAPDRPRGSRPWRVASLPGPPRGRTRVRPAPVVVDPRVLLRTHREAAVVRTRAPVPPLGRLGGVRRRPDLRRRLSSPPAPPRHRFASDAPGRTRRNHWMLPTRSPREATIGCCRPAHHVRQPYGWLPVAHQVKHPDVPGDDLSASAAASCPPCRRVLVPPSPLPAAPPPFAATARSAPPRAPRAGSERVAHQHRLVDQGHAEGVLHAVAHLPRQGRHVGCRRRARGWSRRACAWSTAPPGRASRSPWRTRPSRSATRRWS